jgi:hypothetical protein
MSLAPQLIPTCGIAERVNLLFKGQIYSQRIQICTQKPWAVSEFRHGGMTKSDNTIASSVNRKMQNELGSALRLRGELNFRRCADRSRTATYNVVNVVNGNTD